MNYLNSIILGLLLMVFSSASIAQQPLQIRYMPSEGDDDSRNELYVELLKLALEKTVGTDGPYELVYTGTDMTQNEGLRAIINNQGIDIINTMTSRQRETVLRPIRIPLDRGLLGMRVLLVNSDRSEHVNRLTSAGNEASLRLGQGSDWPDTDILRQAGYTVVTHDSYQNLFTMLKHNEFDAFPRSVLEVFYELEQYPDLKIEENIAIRYPTAMYFFTHRTNSRLADRVEKGLMMAIDDGSFQEIFYKYLGGLISKANLDNRRIIEIPNPYLRPETPTGNPIFWH